MARSGGRPVVRSSGRPAILARSPDGRSYGPSRPRDLTRPVLRKLFLLRTFTPRPADITRRWLVIDAEGAILGRMSTEIATLLRGKHKPIWAPHVDTGDHVIVINASKLAIDPKKATDKLYHRHTGYPGGIRTESLEHLIARDPERVVRLAVRRMLPKGPLGSPDVEEAQDLRRPDATRTTRSSRSTTAAGPRPRAARHRADLPLKGRDSCPSP